MSTPTLRLLPPTTTKREIAVSPISRRAALRGIGGLSAVAALTAVPRLTKAGPEHTQASGSSSDVPNAVFGTWDLTFKRLDHDDDHVLVTFAADGEVQSASSPISVTPDGRVRFNTNGLGSWTASDINTVVARYTVLIYDETGAFAGNRTVGLHVQPNAEDGTLTGAFERMDYDLEGELVDFVSGGVDAVPARARGILRTQATPEGVGPMPVATDQVNLPPQPGVRGEPF